jgi:hypothetical protein
MSDADDASPDAGDRPLDGDPATADAAGSSRWTQRSGWIADPAEPSTAPVAPPPTRPVRTRSRIVAAATGDEIDLTPPTPPTAEDAIDLTTSAPTPPALPPPLGGSVAGQNGGGEPIDLRSEEVRALLQQGAPSAGVAPTAAGQQNDAVTNAPTGTSGTEPSGNGRAQPTESTTKWGASRVVPSTEPPPARLEEVVADSKYGPSLVSLSDATDPGLLLTPARPPAETEAIPDAPAVPRAALSEEQAAVSAPDEVNFPDASVAPEAAAAGATAGRPMRPGGPTTTGDRPKPGPRPSGAEPGPKFGMAPVTKIREAVDDPDAPPGDTPTRSLATTGGLPATIDDDRRSGGSRVFTSGLFIVALALAVAAGILGALWQRERTANDDLRAQLAVANTAGETEQGELDALIEANRTLELQNEELQRERDELQTFVAPVPEGRITEIEVPFVPAQVDEARDRLIAVDANGEYVVWGTGVDGGITDSGRVAGPPSSMFAHRDNAWIATEEGGIEVISLVDGSDVLAIATAEVSLIVPSSRTVWSFVPGSRELRRHRETNGNVRATVTLPVEIRELSSGAGSVWALGEDGLVYRVNTADLTVAPIPAGQEVVSISAGTDALWALSAADGSLRRVDAVSGEVLVTVPVGRDPVAVEFSGSSVWVALRSGEALIEVDTRTAAVVSRTSLPGVPIDVTAGSNGVLVTLEGDVPLVRVASIGTDETVTPLEDDATEADAEVAEDAQADG